jgi:hypothetical protein
MLIGVKHVSDNHICMSCSLSVRLTSLYVKLQRDGKTPVMSVVRFKPEIVGRRFRARHNFRVSVAVRLQRRTGVMFCGGAPSILICFRDFPLFLAANSGMLPRLGRDSSFQILSTSFNIPQFNTLLTDDVVKQQEDQPHSTFSNFLRNKTIICINVRVIGAFSCSP